jgi:hypothetical protein
MICLFETAMFERLATNVLQSYLKEYVKDANVELLRVGLRNGSNATNPFSSHRRSHTQRPRT